MLPVLSVIGTGLSVLSSINSLMSEKPVVTKPPTAAEIAAASAKNNVDTSPIELPGA